MKLALKVIPNAKKSEAVGWEEDPRAGRALKLRIAAPPVEGKANKVVVLFLSHADSPPSRQGRHHADP